MQQSKDHSSELFDAPARLGYPTEVKDEAPIVFIGGLGGSGTRAVAGAMAGLGYYPGGCLNVSNDNLIFTELFKRPDWVRSGPPESAIRERLTLFERVMREGIDPEAVVAWSGLAKFMLQQGRGLAGRPDTVGWMTKEPNCHFFLESILDRWPNAVFVYVVRHPLDMAFSRNRSQLGNWGWLFGLEARDFSTPEAAQLEFWIRAQRRLDGLVERFLGRIRSLYFEDFVERPEQELTALVEELALPVPLGRVPEASGAVIRPESMGLYRSRDLSVFGEDQLAFCSAAGWPI